MTEQQETPVVKETESAKEPHAARHTHAVTRLKKLKTWSFDHWIALIGLISGIAIGVGIPVYQNYWVETPELKAEITGIERSPTVAPSISLPKNPALSFLVEYQSPRSIEASFFRRTLRESETPTGDTLKVTMDVLQNLYDRANGDLDNLSQKINDYKNNLQTIQSLEPKTITLRMVEQLNLPLFPEVEVDESEFNSKLQNRDTNSTYFNDIISRFKTQYDEELRSLVERRDKLSKNIPTAAYEIEKISSSLSDKNNVNTKFVFTTVLCNSGKASTSIRRQALIRVYIGHGIYIDLELKLQPTLSTEIEPSKTLIAAFESEEVSKMLDRDQKLVNTYWGQSVRAILFIEDISGNIIQSDAIAFSPGWYEKSIYDRLRIKAAVLQLN